MLIPGQSPIDIKFNINVLYLLCNRLTSLNQHHLMAIAKYGINGAFSGKIGSVIGYEVGGQHVMRTVGKRTKPFTERELLNQAKTKAVSEFLKPIKPYIQLGFRPAAPPGSRIGAFQLAQSYTYRHAIEVDAESKPYVRPEKVLVSNGKLLPPQNITVSREGNRLTFQWDFPGGNGGFDRLMVLLYDGSQFSFFREIGADRHDLQDTWAIEHLSHIKTPMHVYAAFRDTVSGGISDSVYCGVV